MEQTGNAEVPTLDKQKALQRERILHERIKNPQARSLILKLIPSDGVTPNISPDKELLKQFAESLGKDTHTILFGLAATAKNPMELSKILRNIVNLKNINPLHWKFEESEAHFLNRDLSESINVSEGAKEQAENMLNGRNAAENASNPQYLLESFFYIFSRKDVPLADKRRILNEFYNTKGLTPSPFGNLGNKNAREIYNSQSSFWNQVDGSWIYSDGEQSKKPNPVVTAVKDVLEGRKQYEKQRNDLLAQIVGLTQELNEYAIRHQQDGEQNAALSARITDLGQRLFETNVRATNSERSNGELQRNLDTAQTTNRDLARQLREAQQRQQGQQNGEQNADLLAQISDLNRKFTESSSEAARFAKNNRDLQKKLDISQAEKGELARQLREAQQRQQPRTKPFKEPSENEGRPRDPYVVLDISPSASSAKILKQYRNLKDVIHPDRASGLLGRLGYNSEEIAEGERRATLISQELDIALDTLKKQGKVPSS